MKTIAFYVPQFHAIPLNDKYWGKGFTEWDNVRGSKPIFEGHNQPRIPLNNNYYNLLSDDVKKWQVDLANQYGIYGFCFYHYWFNGTLLLEKPVEQFLSNQKLNIHFCFSWANEAWTMEWVGKNKTLISQYYGEKEEWKKHFDYLLPFFKDSRYIKENGKPVFVIYRPGSITCLNEMMTYWQQLAIENGFPGLVIMNQNPLYMREKNHSDVIDYDIEFEPACSRQNIYGRKFRFLKAIKKRLVSFCEKHFGWDLQRTGQNAMAKMTKSKFPSYDEAWKNILSRRPYSSRSIPCAFTDWDNSPRYHEKAIVYKGGNPEKFKKYFLELLQKARDEYKTEYVFITAWNEWGEGCYLEPDTINEYGYLQGIKASIDQFGDNNYGK